VTSARSLNDLWVLSGQHVAAQPPTLQHTRGRVDMLYYESLHVFPPTLTFKMMKATVSEEVGRT
jgi:hypothetical protein